MQIPQNWNDVSVGLEVEKDGQTWKVIRLVDQTSFKGGVVVKEKYIQLLSSEGQVGFHHYSVEVKA
jgi:hypothetical protein